MPRFVHDIETGSLSRLRNWKPVVRTFHICYQESSGWSMAMALSVLLCIIVMLTLTIWNSAATTLLWRLSDGTPFYKARTTRSKNSVFSLTMRLTLGITGLYFGAKIYVLICFNSFSLFFEGFNCKEVTYHNPLYLGTLQTRSSVIPSVLIRVTRNTSCNVLLYEQNKRTIRLVWIASSWLLHQHSYYKAIFFIILQYNIYRGFFHIWVVVHRVNPPSLIALD